jgi:hypothetical protein
MSTQNEIAAAKARFATAAAAGCVSASQGKHSALSSFDRREINVSSVTSTNDQIK